VLVPLLLGGPLSGARVDGGLDLAFLQDGPHGRPLLVAYAAQARVGARRVKLAQKSTELAQRFSTHRYPVGKEGSFVSRYP